MADVKQNVKAVFCTALEQQSTQELAEYLDTACGDDEQLRGQVETLLDAHREAGNFLGGP